MDKQANGGRGMGVTDVFMPMVSIHYAEDSANATVTPGDVFGVWHEAESWALPFDKLPRYEFQLIDRGYMVNSQRKADGSVDVVAYSAEYKRRKGWGE